MTTPAAETGNTLAVAHALLEAGCVSFCTREPYRLPSGWASPVYMDCRRLIAYPTLRRDLVQRALVLLREQGALDGLDSVTGGEASGIALAAWIAESLSLPLQYVRKRAAGLGNASQVEGAVIAGGRTLLVDDMMAAGHSKMRFCKALAAAGQSVRDIFVVFDYRTFPTRSLLAPLGLRVHALASWQDVHRAAAEGGHGVSPQALDKLGDFLKDPSAWSASHGGASAQSVPSP